MPRQSMREEIVEAALQRFHTRGYNAAGVKDITRDAGVPKGSFYNHFDSKESLAVVALKRYGEGRRMTDLVNRDLEPVVRIRRHFESLREEIVDADYTRGCLFGNFGVEVADHSDIIRTAVREGLERWARLVAAALAEARAAGTIRADLDPDTTARFLLNAWEGTLIEVRARRSARAFDSFFTIVFGSLLT
jgi:TetR/AcrR family transcriptional regulator, transcriptional repressor for nem operon